MKNTTGSLTANDPRYRAMFDVAKEAMQTTGRVEGDLTPRMNALREQSPVMKGSLRRILELPEVHMAFDQTFCFRLRYIRRAPACRTSGARYWR
jgi:hypothetical protein